MSSILFYSTQKTQKLYRIVPKNFRKKNENENFEPSHSATKCKMEDPIGFLNIFVAKHQKKTLKGDPFVKNNFRKKASLCQKN